MLEFRIRMEGAERQRKEQWYHTRWLSFHTLAAFGAAKGLTLEKHLPLDSKKVVQKGMSESQKQSLQEARERAKKQLNGSRT